MSAMSTRAKARTVGKKVDPKDLTDEKLIQECERLRKDVEKERREDEKRELEGYRLIQESDKLMPEIKRRQKDRASKKGKTNLETNEEFNEQLAEEFEKIKNEIDRIKKEQKDRVRRKNDACKALYSAVRKGSLEKLNAAVALGADVNYLGDKPLSASGHSDNLQDRIHSGNSALHLACWLGSNIWSRLQGREIIDRLLELGSDIHLESHGGGYSPIHTVVQSRDGELVELLLDRGCDPNAIDIDGYSPLFWSIYIGSGDVARALLDRGADISQNDNEGNTSLIIASQRGNKKMVDLLLSRGADVSDTDSNGRSAFDISVLYHHTGIINTIDRWPFTMGLLSLQELSLYYKLDCSSIIDLWQYIV